MAQSLADEIKEMINGNIAVGRYWNLMRRAETALRRQSAALEFYASEADAASRYMTEGKQSKADALLAVLTVLANDGGRRARDAAKDGE